MAAPSVDAAPTEAQGPDPTVDGDASLPRPYLEVETAVPMPQDKGIVEDAELQKERARAVEADARQRVPRPYLEIETDEDENSPHYEHKISLDLTPLSCKSTDSSLEYSNPNQTIIILDWDDTMCPSTTCMRHYGLSVLGAPPEGEVAQALEGLCVEARALLEQACELAEKVVIVTNAEEGWVDLSCKAWLPGLLDSVNNVEVASARSTWEPRGVASPAGWKARTFEDAIDKFYSRYAHQSWKNIISIGDAPHEREALARAVRWAPGGREIGRAHV